MTSGFGSEWHNGMLANGLRELDKRGLQAAYVGHLYLRSGKKMLRHILNSSASVVRRLVNLNSSESVVH